MKQEIAPGSHQDELEQKDNKDCAAVPGGKCPQCGKGILDYNGMLNLECPNCGYESGYGFT